MPLSRVPYAQLKVRIQPRAKENRIVGWYGDALKIRLTAPPVDQKANDELILFLAETLLLPASVFTITHGRTGRTKQLRIDGIDEQRLLEKLKPLLRES